MSTSPPPAALPVGSTLDRGFALLRRHPRPLLLTQLVLNVIPLLVAAVLVLIGILLIGHVDTRTEAVRESTFFGDSTLTTRETPDFTGGQLGTLIGLATIGAIVYLWFIIAAYVSVVRGAERALAGDEPLPLREAVRQSLAATPALFGLAIVFWVLVAIALVVAIAIVAILAQASAGLAVLAGLVVLLGCVYVGVRLFLWPIVYLTEGLRFAAFGRAWRLTRKRFWSLFGLLLLVTIVVTVVYGVVSLLLELAISGLSALDDTVGAVALVPYAILATIFSLVFVAGYIAPIVVAHRTLAGTDTEDLWHAAGAMQGGAPGAGGAAPVPGSGETGWDAAESELWARPRRARPSDPADAPGAPEPSGGATPAADDEGSPWRRPSDEPQG